ncbi:MAG: hypothetical protein LBF54_02995 [Holosporaceae bacterium]|nr:hypothetical protein [Holosporaceae bacterium]
MKDSAFREDFALRRVNPYIFSMIIDFALNFLRFEKVSNIKTAIRLNLLNFETFIEKMTKTLNA